jgi:hypothetical protein
MHQGPNERLGASGRLLAEGRVERETEDGEVRITRLIVCRLNDRG